MKLPGAAIQTFLHKTYSSECPGGDSYVFYLYPIGWWKAFKMFFHIQFDFFSLVKYPYAFYPFLWNLTIFISGFFCFLFFCLTIFIKKKWKGRDLEGWKKEENNHQRFYVVFFYEWQLIQKGEKNSVLAVLTADSGSSWCSFCFLFLLAMAQQHQKTFSGNSMLCKCLSLICTGQNRNLPTT